MCGSVIISALGTEERRRARGFALITSVPFAEDRTTADIIAHPGGS
jgi:hypothetical protein